LLPHISSLFFSIRTMIHFTQNCIPEYLWAQFNYMKNPKRHRPLVIIWPKEIFSLVISLLVYHNNASWLWKLTFSMSWVSLRIPEMTTILSNLNAVAILIYTE
jgi:hypothetical protein